MPNQEIEQRPSIEGSALRQNISGQQSVAQMAYSRDAAGTAAHRPGDAMMLAQHGGLNFQNDQHLLPRDGTLDFLHNQLGGKGLGDQNGAKLHGDQNAANVRDQHAHGAQAGGDKQSAHNLSDTSAAAVSANDQAGNGRSKADSAAGANQQSGGSDTQNGRRNLAPSDGSTPPAANPESTLTPGSRAHATANGEARSESGSATKPGDQAAAGLGKMLDHAQQQYLQNLIDSWMAKHPGQQLPPELASLFNSLAQNGGGAGGAGGGGSDRPASGGSQERQSGSGAGDPPAGHSSDRQSAGRQHYQSSDSGSQPHSQGSHGSDSTGGRTHSRHHAQSPESGGGQQSDAQASGGSRHSESYGGTHGHQHESSAARQHGTESSGRAHYSRNADAPDAGAAARGSDKPTEPTRDARASGGSTGQQSDSNAGTNPHTDRPTGSNSPSDKPAGNNQQADRQAGNAGTDGSANKQNAERAAQTPHDGSQHIQPQQSHSGRFEWNANAHKIYNFLTNDMHFTKAQASGIMGNFAQENAKFDPSKGGDHGAALGVGQWNGVRKHALENFAAQHGGSAKDLDMQLQFFKHESQTTEKRAINAVRHATTSDRAALAFSNLYERPGHAMNGNRIGNAREVYARFAPDQPDSALAYDGRPGRV